MSTLTKGNFTKSTKDKGWFSNPIMRKFSQIDEYSENHVTYRGIARKCGFFVVTLLIGVALAVASLFLKFDIFNLTDMPITDTMLIGLGVSFVGMIVCPLLAFFAKKTTPVAGALFCMSVGYIYASSGIVFEDQRKPIVLALIITLALFSALAGLFYAGLINVSEKVRSVVTILFATIIIASLLLVVAAIIPATHAIAMFVLSNPLICIGFSVVSVIVVSIFLISDIAKIKEAVDNKLDVKHEWSAAFGLIFTVIWLFIEVLQLVTNINTFTR